MGGAPASVNFGFLGQHDLLLVSLGALAERYFADDPTTAVIKLRQFAEVLAQRTAANLGMPSMPQEWMHGSPWLRLLRREVESLVKGVFGESHLKAQQAKTELASITRELRRLKVQVAAIEERRAKLLADLEK